MYDILFAEKVFIKLAPTNKMPITRHQSFKFDYNGSDIRHHFFFLNYIVC